MSVYTGFFYSSFYLPSQFWVQEVWIWIFVWVVEVFSATCIYVIVLSSSVLILLLRFKKPFVCSVTWFPCVAKYCFELILFATASRVQEVIFFPPSFVSFLSPSLSTSLPSFFFFFFLLLVSLCNFSWSGTCKYRWNWRWTQKSVRYYPDLFFNSFL